jgi:hypothetical protein
MKTTLILILAVGLGLHGTVSFGHERIVHFNITLNAAASALDNSPAYAGFLNTVSPDCNFELATNSMAWGSWFEDDAYWEVPGDLVDQGGFRSVNHFYDPLTGLGLSNIPLDDRARDAVTGQFIPIGNNSFTWASTLDCPGIDIYVIGFGLNANTYNFWSWKNARDYEWHGLTDFDRNTRNAALNDMFRSVGQVMHLLEDTTSPQHVRNERI